MHVGFIKEVKLFTKFGFKLFKMGIIMMKCHIDHVDRQVLYLCTHCTYCLINLYLEYHGRKCFCITVQTAKRQHLFELTTYTKNPNRQAPLLGPSHFQIYPEIYFMAWRRQNVIIHVKCIYLLFYFQLTNENLRTEVMFI